MIKVLSDENKKNWNTEHKNLCGASYCTFVLDDNVGSLYVVVYTTHLWENVQ